MPKHLFSQVDVFSSQPMRGNPVAVVHDAIDEVGNDLDTEVMQSFARWTNLSETTFVLPPHDSGADYRLRIFTPGGELPFAGHPTLGSCRAWLAVGGAPRDPHTIVQECAAGLVRVQRAGDQLTFAAPALTRFGAPEAAVRTDVIDALGVPGQQVQAMSWVVNGPNWLGVLVDSAQTVLDLEPDFGAITALGDVEIGVIGPYADSDRNAAGSASAHDGDADFEVRAFCPGFGMDEDPVTGSLHAGLAQWLIGAGVAPRAYVAAQGSVLHRAGRVVIDAEPPVPEQASGEPEMADIWVGGDTVLRIAGAVDLS